MTSLFSERPPVTHGPAAVSGGLDLEDRHALRRVAGLSTELQDVSEVEYRALRLERVVLIGVWDEGSLASAENSLRELRRLAETAGSEVLDGLIQRRGRVDAATYVGSGKARELAELVAAAGADTVICDGELTPSQLRRLESVVQVKVIDRTALILDIFAQHARRREVPSVVIAGYTNAGKSSLLNALTGAGVLVEDALFATLDPAVRRTVTPSGRGYTLTDTVGFVRHLPHQLIDAFRSTLEETAEADLILHVVDGSDAEPEAQIAAVRGVLAEIGAAHVPELVVVNKIDSADPVVLQGLRAREPGSLSVSAKTGAGLAALRDSIEAALPRLDVQVKVTVPYSRGDLLARAHAEGEVLAADHVADGTLLEARVPPGLAAQLDAALDDCVQVRA